MKDSIANTFSAAASERKLAVRSGVGSMWRTTVRCGMRYGGIALRPWLPPARSGSGSNQPAVCRFAVCSSYFQATIVPAASSPAETTSVTSGRLGEYENSSSRVH